MSKTMYGIPTLTLSINSHARLPRLQEIYLTIKVVPVTRAFPDASLKITYLYQVMVLLTTVTIASY